MKRWKWTRKRYEHARRLSRLIGALTSLPDQAPRIVQAYWDLMRPLDQAHDPMSFGWWYRDLHSRLAMRKDDGIPF
jgi:hypothetical protein